MNTTYINKNLNAEPSIANRCLQSCKKLLAGIEQAKKRIGAEFREIVELNQKSFQLALNEAEALAWQTDYPQLIFPTLAVEKVQALAVRQARQRSMQQPHLVFAEAA
ncbi:MAG: hypothetical protein ABR955_08960 [Verrucomicrobiota bacterium]|jgi:hypothetical protein